jgi:RNA polymerase sigma-54 factor
MAVKQSLSLRQGQSLVMTPQLQQAIRLLQLSHLELAEFVAEEIAGNPLLEQGEQASEGGPAAEPAPQDDTFTATDRGMAAIESEGPHQAGLDLPDEALWPEGQSESLRWRESAGRAADDWDPLASAGDKPISLRAHLLAQTRLAIGDPLDRAIGLKLLEGLDEAGYLRADLEALAASLGCPDSRVEAVLAVMQGLEPAGVFARSLKECLTLQLIEQDALDEPMQRLLDRLDLLARRDLKVLCTICGVDEATLSAMIRLIRRLDPKPGAGFDAVPPPVLIPDILVRGAPDGGFLVELNSETLPRVLINRQYHARLSGACTSSTDSQYLANSLQSASWLVRALDQRARTVLKVAEEIVKHQAGFLRHGIEHLRPLTLREVAENIAMHESTVSRVVANKYMTTPRGAFELRFFFGAALGNNQAGEAHAAEAVRHRIKAMIESEPPNEVLSDDTIAATLSEAGIAIARRTVAKYRESLRIPSSMERRRNKRLVLSPGGYQASV